jgi:hypothetical protein
MFAPASFRASAEPISARRPELSLSLLPYEYIFLRIKSGS